MSWNEPEKDGKDPWGGGNGKNQGPPDLDEIARRVKRNFKRTFGKKGGGGSSGGKGAAAMGFGFVFFIIFALWVLSGIYIVAPAEQAVVLRFGQYVNTVGPGPHWIPRFIDSRYIINVEEINSFLYKAEMLTVDENIVSVALSVQYRAEDPRKFLFNVVNPIESLRQATASALRQVVGNTELDEILTTGRQKVRDQVSDSLSEIFDRYQTGIQVVDVNLQPAKPPEQVTAAFDDAIKAREDEQRYINQAQAYFNKIEAITRGKVERIKFEAQADRDRMIAAAQGDVASYLALLPEYKRAPTVTRERLYLEAVENILGNTSKVLVDVKGSNNMMYLPLDKIVQNYHSGKGNQSEADEMADSEDGSGSSSSSAPPLRHTTPSRSSYSNYSRARTGGTSLWQQ